MPHHQEQGGREASGTFATMEPLKHHDALDQLPRTTRCCTSKHRVLGNRAPGALPLSTGCSTTKHRVLHHLALGAAPASTGCSTT